MVDPVDTSVTLPPDAALRAAPTNGADYSLADIAGFKSVLDTVCSGSPYAFWCVVGSPWDSPFLLRIANKSAKGWGYCIIDILFIYLRKIQPRRTSKERLAL
jgi:hypothetical protein